MPIAADISVSSTGDIRYTGSGTTYTVLELHRFLQDLADDAVASGDDLLDITDTTPSDRSTDNIITLLAPYNIDDRLAEYLYDGSITQDGGDTVYSGLVVVGSVEAGTELQIIQDNRVLKNYWGTGLNADAGANILLRIMVKTREFGADIDGKRIRVQARELGDRFAEFSATLGLGNATAAVFTSSDLNNQTASATIAGWSSIVNVEGLQLLDIDGNSTPEEYYSQWDKGSQSINDVYERTKWLAQRAELESFGADTGSNFPVGNGTITQQAQSFAASAYGKKIVRVRFQLKKVGAPTGLARVYLYAHSGTFGSSSIATGAALATSEEIDVSKLTTAYQEIEIRFLDGAQYEMTASTNYVIAIEYTGGDGSNYVDVRGLASTGTAAGNRASFAGSWTAAALDDLWFEVYASPELYAMSGELFRGITHSFAYDNEASGPFVQNEIIVWGTTFNYDTETGADGWTVGEYLQIGTRVGKLLYLLDSGTTGTMVVAVEGGLSLADNDVITQLDGGDMQALVNGAPTGNGVAGGSAAILALDDDGTTGNLYVQLLTGSIVVDNVQIRGRTSGATADVFGSPTARTVSPEFIGQSTGSALIGAYGVGVQPADLTASDLLFDLTNTPRVPPNNVTFTVNGLVSGEDRVLVGPESGGSLQLNQFTLNGALSGGEATITVNGSIPSDTPATGTIRVFDGSTYVRVTYTGRSGSNFTGCSGTPAAADGNNVFISYIDKLATATSESFTAVYLAPRSLFIRVRDGGGTPIKTFETTGTLGSAGGTATAIRTTDA